MKLLSYPAAEISVVGQFDLWGRMNEAAEKRLFNDPGRSRLGKRLLSRAREQAPGTYETDPLPRFLRGFNPKMTVELRWEFIGASIDRKTTPKRGFPGKRPTKRSCLTTKGVFAVTRLCRSLIILSTFLLFASFAAAQTSVDVNLGFGSYHDSATGAGIDNALSLNAFGGCALSSGDTFCEATPKMGSFFLDFGGDVMFWKHLGAGFAIDVQPSTHSYGPLNYRQSFYDANAIYAPISAKRVSLRLEGGIGEARTSFGFSQSGCVGTAVCNTSNEPVGSSGHFDVHFGVGVQIYVTEHVFIRPQFDYHYVPGLTNQFGSNSVPGGTIWVGYTFGGGG